MSIRKKGKHYYSSSQAEIMEVLTDYSQSVKYIAEHFKNAKCECGTSQFKLLLDDTAGAATRICTKCGNEHAIGDSSNYVDEAELEECECPCGSEIFEITVGVSLYHDTEDVKWIYIGCRCPQCDLTACYGDWKNEYEDYKKLLKLV